MVRIRFLKQAAEYLLKKISGIERSPVQLESYGIAIMPHYLALGSDPLRNGLSIRIFPSDNTFKPIPAKDQDDAVKIIQTLISLYGVPGSVSYGKFPDFMERERLAEDISDLLDDKK